MIAVMSDIHGNLPALQAVIEDAESYGVRDYLILGDIVGYGAEPGECIEALIKLNAIAVRGNHDHAVIDPDNRYLDRFNESAKDAIYHSKTVLTLEHKIYLARLPIFKESNGAHMVHGSMVDPFSYVEGIHDATRSFEKQFLQVCFIGHTHVPVIYRSANGYVQVLEPTTLFMGSMSKYLINVGSVGQPRDGDPRACYVLWDDDMVTYRRVSYDIEKAQQGILEAGLPSRLASRLATG